MEVLQEQPQEEIYTRAGIRTFKGSFIDADGELKAVYRSFFWNTKTHKLVCRGTKPDALKAALEATEKVCDLALRLDSPVTVVASYPAALATCPTRQPRAIFTLGSLLPTQSGGQAPALSEAEWKSRVDSWFEGYCAKTVATASQATSPAPTSAPTQGGAEPAPAPSSPLAAALVLATRRLSSAAGAAGALVAHSPAAIAEAVHVALTPILGRMEASQGRMEASQGRMEASQADLLAGQEAIQEDLRSARKERKAAAKVAMLTFEQVEENAGELEAERQIAAQRDAAARLAAAEVTERVRQAAEEAAERDAAAVKWRADVAAHMKVSEEWLSIQVAQLRAQPTSGEATVWQGVDPDLIAVGEALVVPPSPKTLPERVVAAGATALSLGAVVGSAVVEPVLLAVGSPSKSPQAAPRQPVALGEEGHRACHDRHAHTAAQRPPWRHARRHRHTRGHHVRRHHHARRHRRHARHRHAGRAYDGAGGGRGAVDVTGGVASPHGAEGDAAAC